ASWRGAVAGWAFASGTAKSPATTSATPNLTRVCRRCMTYPPRSAPPPSVMLVVEEVDDLTPRVLDPAENRLAEALRAVVEAVADLSRALRGRLIGGPVRRLLACAGSTLLRWLALAAHLTRSALGLGGGEPRSHGQRGARED